LIPGGDNGADVMMTAGMEINGTSAPDHAVQREVT